MKCAELLPLIERCIALCEAEKVSGYSGEATQEQVEVYILPELNELKQKLLSEDLPRDRYLNSFGYAFRYWNWDMNNASELYLSLLSLHNAYQISET